MDKKLPIIPKKFVRMAYFILRKGLSSKRKLMFDVNLLMRRSKTAFQNLTFQSHSVNQGHQLTCQEYYEFSCSNTPAFHFPFNLNKQSHHAPATEDKDVLMMNAAILKAMEMLDQKEIASRTPTVRQLRITDSPFPLRGAADPGDIISHVDEKADEFISRFYRDLRREASAFT
ncbi:unnamed protein product [Withania somnifera]